MPYDIIFFDADDTLFDFQASEETAFEKTLADHGIFGDADQYLALYKEINEALWAAFERGEIDQDHLKVERFRQFLDQIDVAEDPEAFGRRYMKNLSKASILYEESAPLLEKLSKSHRLAILTNGLTHVQEVRVKQSIIAHHIEAFIISEEVGVAKPDPEIFKILLRQMDNATPDRVLMVGDSLTSDIQGGINAGIDTCWYNPEGKRNTTGLKPTYEIQRLEQILDVL